VPRVIESLHPSDEIVRSRIPSEDYVIVAIRIKWLVQVHEIKRPIRNLRQNFKVVAAEKPVQRALPPPGLAIKPSMTPDRKKQN
jgi:hypothetical protein